MSRVVSATSARRNDEEIVNAADALDAAANKGKVGSVLHGRYNCCNAIRMTAG